jgi:hypothetical protein
MNARAARGENRHLRVTARLNDRCREEPGHHRETPMADTRLHDMYDPQTVALFKASLIEAWVSLRPEQRARVSRSVLVAGLLRSAAAGERDPDRLRDAALAEGLSCTLH